MAVLQVLTHGMLLSTPLSETYHIRLSLSLYYYRIILRCIILVWDTCNCAAKTKNLSRYPNPEEIAEINNIISKRASEICFNIKCGL